MDSQVFKGCERLYKETFFNNLKEMLMNTKKMYSDRPAFRFKTEEKGVYKEMLYKDYIEEIESLSTALNSLGLENKRIGIIGENRYEWEEAFLAITTGTGIVVPLDKSLPEDEILNLIERSEMEAIFFSGKYQSIMEKVKVEKVGKIETFISMDLEKSEEEFKSQKELISIGRGLIKNGSKSYEKHTINETKMGIMLFTSGTTAKSKAVMLSQRNICANIYDIASVFDCNDHDIFLSFLPLHHTFESTVGFLYPVESGGCIAFCEGIRHIADNIREFQISCMISVPLLFESMYKKLLKTIEKQGKLKKFKFGQKLSKFLFTIGIDKRREIFKDIHESLGGHLRLFVTGAAALDKEAEVGFNSFGIETYQGYGLTETSPVIAAEHKTVARNGSVGRMFPSIEGKVIDKDDKGVGELVVKGPSVMLGYYDNEEATKEVFTEDGWFKTGDLGYFDRDGYFFITGRKKDVIVLKNGKNIYPEEIEILINRIPGVKESYVYGKPEDGDEVDLKICAKVVYDKDLAKNVFGTDDEQVIHDKIWAEIKENVNKKMPTYKYVKGLIITDKELIKTTTQKIKRFEEYKTVVEN